MTLDPAWLSATTVVSAFGVALIVYGRKNARIPHALAGVILAVAPYFFHSIGNMAGFAAGVVGSLWLASRMGL